MAWKCQRTELEPDELIPGRVIEVQTWSRHGEPMLYDVRPGENGEADVLYWPLGLGAEARRRIAIHQAANAVKQKMRMRRK